MGQKFVPSLRQNAPWTRKEIFAQKVFDYLPVTAVYRKGMPSCIRRSSTSIRPGSFLRAQRIFRGKSRWACRNRWIAARRMHARDKTARIRAVSKDKSGKKKWKKKWKFFFKKMEKNEKKNEKKWKKKEKNGKKRKKKKKNGKKRKKKKKKKKKKRNFFHPRWDVNEKFGKKRFRTRIFHP